MSEDGQRLSARVVGRVQGVGYRWATARRARALGLVGWVMNLDDDRTVEVVAEGEPAALSQLEAFLRSGPPGAQVDRVEVRRSPASGKFDRFGITRP